MCSFHASHDASFTTHRSRHALSLPGDTACDNLSVCDCLYSVCSLVAAVCLQRSGGRLAAGPAYGRPTTQVQVIIRAADISSDEKSPIPPHPLPASLGAREERWCGTPILAAWPLRCEPITPGPSAGRRISPSNRARATLLDRPPPCHPSRR